MNLWRNYLHQLFLSFSLSLPDDMCITISTWFPLKFYGKLLSSICILPLNLRIELQSCPWRRRVWRTNEWLLVLLSRYLLGLHQKKKKENVFSENIIPGILGGSLSRSTCILFSIDRLRGHNTRTELQLQSRGNECSWRPRDGATS